MSLVNLRTGLWIRMGVASLLGLVGVLVLFVVEIVLASLISFAFVEGVPEMAGMVLVLVLVASGFLLGWWLTATVLARLVSPGALSERLAHDGVSDAAAGLGGLFWNPTQVVPPKYLGLAGGGALSFILLYTLIVDVLEISAAYIGVVVGLGFVGWQTYRLVETELRQDGAVRSDLEEAYGVIEDDEREPELRARVRRLARQADVPTPEVRVGTTRTPQAATVGYRAEQSVIVVSRGLLETLDDHELDAVLAHELAHLSNRDAAVLTGLLFPATKASMVLTRFNHPIILVVVAPVYVSSRVSVAIVARYREYVADAAAASVTGNPAALASALEKLDGDRSRRPDTDMRAERSTAAFGIVPPPWQEKRYFDGAARFVVRGVLGTHPSTDSRIERLRNAADATESRTVTAEQQ
ncbi:M48 family metallopeptidase [Natronorubrum daqingense]|uniref:Peptidase family M48 n=1 Tax=Natronorubrum daqingense TaxID=588898 RepID=A0A1N7DWB7_9EURY|nr:M48 family metalloprotease [Natronorubrum daqingense]APX96217.1 hypothetical protein BB347_06025 [Natronorubrum daqingense]SIR80132.1 Peptidase family M48 [Natronorubrum daqingense]